MNNFLFFIITALLINLTPGPAMLFCMNQTLQNGISSGVLAAFGVELGVFVYVIASSLGLGLFFNKYPHIFTIIQMLGLIYLLYLAYQEWPRKKNVAIQNNVKAVEKNMNSFIKGLMINLTNPKIGLFFVSLMPQFVSYSSKSNHLTFLIYGLIFNFGGFFVNMNIALAAQKISVFIHSKVKHWMGYIPPILFILIALKVLEGVY